MITMEENVVFRSSRAVPFLKVYKTGAMQDHRSTSVNFRTKKTLCDIDELHEADEEGL